MIIIDDRVNFFKMETQSSNSNANASHNDDAKDQEKDSESNSSELEQGPLNISEGHNNKDTAMASTDAQEGGNESLLPPQKRLRTASITSAPDKTLNITALNNQTPHNHAEAASVAVDYVDNSNISTSQEELGSSLTPASLPPTHDNNDNEREDRTGGDEDSDDGNGNSGYDTTSAASASATPNGSLSPVSPPPAPPSTPASAEPSILQFQDAVTPRPSYNAEYANTSFPAVPYIETHGVMENASALVDAQLQQQQQQGSTLTGAETAATPAPATRRTGDKERTTPPLQSSQSLVEDFSGWAVGERYELMRTLGRGSYGEVAQARDLRVASEKDACCFVAIKRIKSAFDQEVDAIRLYREMHILRRLRGHECIIQLLDVVQPPSDDLDDFHDLYLVFECKLTGQYVSEYLDDVILVDICSTMCMDHWSFLFSSSHLLSTI